MKLRDISFYFYIALAFSLSGCSKNIDKTKAGEIARQKLQEYCEKESLSLSDFKLKELSSDGDIPWVFEYVTISTTPRHNVVIDVDKAAFREIHRMIEPEDWYDSHPRPEKPISPKT